jgi:FMN reductase
MSKKIVIINGNPSKTSRLTGLLEFAKAELIKLDVQVDMLHVVDIPAEDLIFAKFGSPAVGDAVKLVEHADAVIIASPVYKASYTGVLKTFLDLLPQKGLHGKVVLPLFIGGSIAHLLAIDYALKPVLSVLGARYQLGGVYAVDKQIVKTDDGRYEIDEEITQRMHAALEELVSAKL